MQVFYRVIAEFFVGCNNTDSMNCWSCERKVCKVILESKILRYIHTLEQFYRSVLGEAFAESLNEAKK